MNATHAHKFEVAGLGVAPFKYVGSFEKVHQPHPSAPAQPAGTCEFCSNGIKECCVIEDKNGKRFIVGNTCVFKTIRKRK